MRCNICNNQSKRIFTATVLAKHQVVYFACPVCEFIQTEKPYWLDEAYASPINKTDTGILARNIDLAETVSLLIYYFFRKNGIFLDYAGGYGFFTRLMRDIGFDFYTEDPHSQNLVARGFEFDREKTNAVELITALECFEHFENPLKEIERMLSLSGNIFFSTYLVPSSIPSSPDQWWYFGLEHGQHIALYSKKTLEFIAKKYDLIYHTNGINLHMFTKKKMPWFSFKTLQRMKRLGLFYFVKKRMKGKHKQDMQYILSLRNKK